MDPKSGEIVETRLKSAVGEELQAERLRELMLEVGDLTDSETRALEKLEQGDKLVAVTEEVAHAQRVGQRELERRRRRRRQLRGIAGS